MTRSKSGVKWLGPVLSVAVACGLFANCSTEERDFEAGRNRGNGNADAGGADASTDGGDAGQFAANDCVGQDNGEACGEMSGFICVNQSCRESSCGDGYVDEETNEECDDGNTDAADGCEPVTCEITCQENADCDDGDPCNGEEACDMGRNMCMTGDAPDTTEQVPCTLPLPPAMDAGAIADSGTPGDSGLILTDASGSILSDGSVPDGSVADGSVVDAGEPVDSNIGFCKAGLCVPAGCGNGILQSGEECDDFNLDNDDGCKADCTYTCETDAECDDQSVCTGVETCDTDDHVCIAGTNLACEDDIDCTHNDCDAITGCINSLIDTDGDGHAPDDFACGDDCDDGDATSYTGAGDLCGDDIDNDCNGQADDAVPFWFLDCDGDDYAQQGAPSAQQCNAPAPLGGCVAPGWTTRIPINGDLTTLDCYDANPDAHPSRNPDTFSTTAVPPGKAAPLEFDWNCDGTEEKQYPNAVAVDAYCGSPFYEASSGLIYVSFCWGSAGYASPPACGNPGTFTSCSSASGTCERVYTYDYLQPCR